ncbi:hypothetical protein FTUN_0059 [Frigoriglobus tundricola]|uniref:Uncharacterized protein n=1 Tax=Frigoriglobus tundricola TaxID=2774151 RepID=A0A6M5YH39_9BACT|nr:hypothetical protein FTUN_0059 [Frigoriglobus tundricola]
MRFADRVGQVRSESLLEGSVPFLPASGFAGGIASKTVSQAGK